MALCIVALSADIAHEIPRILTTQHVRFHLLAVATLFKWPHLIAKRADVGFTVEVVFLVRVSFCSVDILSISKSGLNNLLTGSETGLSK